MVLQLVQELKFSYFQNEQKNEQKHFCIFALSLSKIGQIRKRIKIITLEDRYYFYDLTPFRG